MKPFDKSETAIRMGLSRAVKSGIVKNVREGRQVFYEITQSGIKYIEELKEARQLFWRKLSLKKNTWNNYWCMTVLEPNINTKERNDISVYLKKVGFGQLGRGCYIHPLDLSKEVHTKSEEIGLNDNVWVVMSKLTTNQSTSRLANRLWNIEALKKMYLDFSIKYPPTLGIWNPVHDEKLISFCQEFINDFNIIMEMDPVLPNEFTGFNWEGENVLRMLDYFNKTVVPKTKELVDKIIQ